MKGQHLFRKDPPYSLHRSVMKQKMDFQTLVMLWKNSLHFFSPGGILQSSQLGLCQQHQALKMHFLTRGHPQILPGFNFLLLAGKNLPVRGSHTPPSCDFHPGHVDVRGDTGRARKSSWHARECAGNPIPGSHKLLILRAFSPVFSLTGCALT